MRSWQQFGVLAGFGVQLLNGLKAPRINRPLSQRLSKLNDTDENAPYVDIRYKPAGESAGETSGCSSAVQKARLIQVISLLERS